MGSLSHEVRACSLKPTPPLSLRLNFVRKSETCGSCHFCHVTPPSLLSKMGRHEDSLGEWGGTLYPHLKDPTFISLKARPSLSQELLWVPTRWPRWHAPQTSRVRRLLGQCALLALVLLLVTGPSLSAFPSRQFPGSACRGVRFL